MQRRAAKHVRGVLDTSVLIDIELLSADVLPDEMTIAAVSVATCNRKRPGLQSAHFQDGINCD
jgi:hypothetical protein